MRWRRGFGFTDDTYRLGTFLVAAIPHEPQFRMLLQPLPHTEPSAHAAGDIVSYHGRLERSPFSGNGSAQAVGCSHHGTSHLVAARRSSRPARGTIFGGLHCRYAPGRRLQGRFELFAFHWVGRIPLVQGPVVAPKGDHHVFSSLETYRAWHDVLRHSLEQMVRIFVKSPHSQGLTP